MGVADEVKTLVADMGVEDCGIASPGTYQSTRSPGLASIFPGVKSLIVMAYGELSSCESDNMQIAMNGRLDLMEYSRSCNYKLARFLERQHGGKAMTVPVSYPLEMSRKTMGAVADVSMRHAAVAAGLGCFGRHNIIIHPELGSRVIFTAVLTDVEIPPDEPFEGSLCDDCMECVEACPSGALDEEGRTDVLKCLEVCQPNGIGGNIRFWSRFAGAGAEDRKSMLKDEKYWRLYHAQSLGFQYFCFNCLKSCPAGRQ